MGVLLRRWIELAAIVGGVAYLAFVPALPSVPTCAYRVLTSMPCPTCGTTRGLFALLHGDVRLAMQSNPLSFLVPLIVLRRGFVLTTYGTRCSALFNHQAIDRTLMASFFAIALLHYLFVALPAAIR